MRRSLAIAVAVALALGLAVPTRVALAGGPITTTYVSVTCFVDWEPEFRFAGLDGQTGHHHAVITNELWVYDTAWHLVGSEVDTVQDESNYRTGTELFRGSFAIESTLGDFTGTFTWTENRSGARGHANGHATDGSGLLLRWEAGVIDPTATGVPSCAAEREVYNLTSLEVIQP
jgi:hypothetical protein